MNLDSFRKGGGGSVNGGGGVGIDEMIPILHSSPTYETPDGQFYLRCGTVRRDVENFPDAIVGNDGTPHVGNKTSRTVVSGGTTIHYFVRVR